MLPDQVSNHDADAPTYTCLTVNNYVPLLEGSSDERAGGLEECLYLLPWTVGN